MKKNFSVHNAIYGKPESNVPFWFMRQAGRYLPEYREMRAGCNGFLDLCYSPKKACEVTLQPIRRFDMDAAIIFSDILVLPHALGVEVSFVEGEGPKLSPVTDAKSLKFNRERLSPVYEAIALTRAALPEEKSLFGFAGSPWTVACYMIEGQGKRDFETIRKFSITHEKVFSEIIDIIVEATAEHLLLQLEAGADVLQLFDSWAGITTEAQFEKWVILPTQKIVQKIKDKKPDIPIIGFPRMAGGNYRSYVEKTGVDAVSLDSSVPLSLAKELQQKTAVQGNLDPMLLAYDIGKAKAQTEKILQTLGDGKCIFNLGHGIIPQTPPQHVADISALIKGWRK